MFEDNRAPATVYIRFNAVQAGQAIHAATAARVFGVPAESVTPEKRRKAKMVNFGIAYCISVDLIGRAADVMLKERRKLVLVLRETPISLVHARAMTQVIEAGAFVMPAAPSFYSQPRDIGELVDTVVARVLDRLGVPNDLVRRSEGMAPRSRVEPPEET